MWVTLYTDASYHPEKKLGGWAIWLKSAQGRIVRYGRCPKEINGAMSAEIYAAYVGIHMALRDWTDVEGILVNSDNQAVCRGLWEWSKPTADPIFNRIQLKIQQRTKDIKIRTKHVKGHQYFQKDVRAYLNNRCDRLSRNYLREGACPTVQE